MIYRTTEITDFVNVKRLFIVRRNCLWIFLVFLEVLGFGVFSRVRFEPW